MDIKKLINESVITNWKDVLINCIEPYEDIINTKLSCEYATTNNIFPDISLIFNCFNYFNVEDIKCIIVGQDCYHTRDVANGLCFSHSQQKNNKLQPSLRNIFKELQRTEHVVRKESDLSDWAQQGCLLLNMSLTVLEGKPNSHSNIWNPFMNAVIKWISENCENVCIMLWGNFAQTTEIYFRNTNNIILKAGHPSPLNTKNPFIGCGHFEKCNEYHNIKWV